MVSACGYETPPALAAPGGTRPEGLADEGPVIATLRTAATRGSRTPAAGVTVTVTDGTPTGTTPAVGTVALTAQAGITTLKGHHDGHDGVHQAHLHPRHRPVRTAPSSRMTGRDATNDIAAGAAALARGALVAFPTETVYGLGANALDPVAVARVFAAKGRPTNHPLICHVASADDLSPLVAQVTPAARALADAFWPGPLTLVMPRSAAVLDAVTGGLHTVAVRVPNHPIALALLRAFGGPVAAPSANRFGWPSPTRAGDVRAELGDAVDLILDGGPCAIGVESTVLDLASDPPQILRPGSVSPEQITAVINMPVSATSSGPARAPGMLETHYSPGARLEVLAAGDVVARAAALDAVGTRVAVLAPTQVAPLPASTLILGPAGDADAYAALLYAAFRRADADGREVILAVPPPAVGIGIAVRDRLARASAGG